MFASKTTRGFYDAAIHGDNMPADVTPESEWEYTHAELLEGQSNGKVIDFDKDGYPFLADPAPPTEEQLQQQANSEARAYLAETDWYVIRQQETGEPVPAEILAERAAARARVIE